MYVVYKVMYHVCLINNLQNLYISLGNHKSREDFILTHDLEKEISHESPVHYRTKAIKDLCDPILNQQWEDVSMLNLIIKFMYSNVFYFYLSIECC